MDAAGANTGQKALLLFDLQNDFLDPAGAYGRAGQSAPAIAELPRRLAPLVEKVRSSDGLIISTHFTILPGRNGEPMISPHLRELRPFLGAGDFAPGGWGHALVDPLAPSHFQIEKVAYSAFYMTRLEWVLRKNQITTLYVAGIVTNGGVASTVRDAHVRDLDIVVVEDGCAAFSQEAHQIAIEALRPVARISTIESVMRDFG